MDIPKKRKSSGGSPNRSQRRAAQRNGAAGVNGFDAADASGEVDAVEADAQYVPAPPGGCMAWHFYWCASHNDWHHHEESAVEAIAQSLIPNQ